ncbi:MAG TPA: hypothetical protein VHF05_01080 [Candidatus Paceibacterota bacterium]|jgi:hypothetical protein|nr:hypothetical protein [Candidatus Paceibacterota bacterium]
MKRSTKITTGLAAAALTIGLGFSGAGLAHAQTASTTPESRLASLAQAIASKFNLNESDVESVIKDHRAEMQAEREERYKSALDKAVQNSKLTQDQEDKILAKMEELKSERESLQGKTPEEIRSALKTEAASLKQWAADNNIPTEYLRPGFFGGPGRFMGPLGPKDASSTDATSSSQN